MVAVGLASFDKEGVDLWRSTAVIAGPFIVLSAVSASVSLLLARRAKNRALLDAIEDAEKVLPEGKAHELIGRNKSYERLN
jgi:hypothetical protein